MPPKPKGKSTKGSSDAKPPRPPAQKQLQEEEQEREEVFEQGEAVLARDSGELYDAKVRLVHAAWCVVMHSIDDPFPVSAHRDTCTNAVHALLCNILSAP